MTSVNLLARAVYLIVFCCLPLQPCLAASRPKPGVVVIAHRGGAASYPENTLEAFDNAVFLGANMIEFDMQMTADNHLIVTHDSVVNSSFCLPDAASKVFAAPIRQLTVAQLETFDCGSRHRATYPHQIAVAGARMPTADALFARYKNARVSFFGETKFPSDIKIQVDPVAFTRLVASFVERYGLENRFILQSANYDSLDAMYRINPHIRTCLLYPWRATRNYLLLAQQHHARCILLRLQDADAAQVRQLRDAGIMVISDVVDDEVGWRAYLSRGVDALFTNEPAKLIAFLARR